MGLIPAEQIAAKGFEGAGWEGGWIQKGSAVERGEAVISFNRKESVRVEMVRSKVVPQRGDEMGAQNGQLKNKWTPKASPTGYAWNYF